MAYKCLECGHIFERGEEKYWRESYGEEMCGCPLCGGSFEETRKCAVCGGEFLREELNGYKYEVCEDCQDEYKYNVDVCYRIGDTNKESIEINSLLATLFSVDEIEAVLYRELKEAQKIKPIDCKSFLDIDRDWFVDEMVEEVRKNENGEK